MLNALGDRHRQLPATVPLTLLLSRVVDSALALVAIMERGADAAAGLGQLEDNRRAASSETADAMKLEERPFLLPENRDMVVDAAAHLEHAITDLTRAGHTLESLRTIGGRPEPRRMAELIAWAAGDLQATMALQTDREQALAKVASAKRHLVEVDELRDAALGALLEEHGEALEAVRWRAVLDAFERPAGELMTAASALELAIREGE